MAERGHLERPTATAPVTMGDQGLELVDGVEAKAVVIDQLTRALEVIEHYAPARIATLGGEYAVSVAPFATLAHRYGDDLAILWIDSHPDIGTPASEYPGFHAMAVAALTIATANALMSAQADQLGGTN